MAITDLTTAERQQRILGQAGALSDNKTKDMMGTWWKLHNDKNGEWQDKYVLREALEFLTATKADKHDTKVGTDESKRSQLFSQRFRLLQRVDAEIKDFEERINRGNRSGSMRTRNAALNDGT